MIITVQTKKVKELSKEEMDFIKTTNIDFELITFIKQNLQNLNFSINLYEDKRNSYELSVFGRKQAKRWWEIIGSSNPRNIEKLKLFI